MTATHIVVVDGIAKCDEECPGVVGGEFGADVTNALRSGSSVYCMFMTREGYPTDNKTSISALPECGMGVGKEAK